MNARKTRRAVLVTGGTGGIGGAVAGELRRRGARCWTGSRRLTDDPDARTLRLDVRDERSIATAIDAITARDGRLDDAVLAHGGGRFADVAALDPVAIRDDLDEHVVGTLRLLRRLRGALGRDGSIVIVGSIAATRAFPGCGSYGAAKAAQRMLALVAAEEFRADGIRVTLVHPGAVDTPLWDGREESFDRARMMPAAALAPLIADLLETPPGAHVTEVTVMPRGGVL